MSGILYYYLEKQKEEAGMDLLAHNHSESDKVVVISHPPASENGAFDVKMNENGIYVETIISKNTEDNKE
ncbi:hypothetical protein [Ochrobactrum sp. MYb379]|uniref:hypothetical protein n=1 Tax=Ochrobactrum sp. MYb379 TaxID=2745275 RepID=UPI0030B674E1